MKIKTLDEADTVHTPAQIIQPVCCFPTSQLGLGRPRRDEEVFSQRLQAEEAVAEHQPSPDDGGAHHAPQGGAQVRSQLQTHTHNAELSGHSLYLHHTLVGCSAALPCFYVGRWTL